MRTWRDRSEEGFTLVELMVVILIIAILIAVAVPTFLGVRRGAQDRTAQVDLRNFILAERSFYVENTAYTAVTADLIDMDSSIRLDAADPTQGTVVTINAADDTIVCGTRTAESANTFSVWESATTGTFYGTADLTGACPAAPPAGFTATTW